LNFFILLLVLANYSNLY